MGVARTGGLLVLGLLVAAGACVGLEAEDPPPPALVAVHEDLTAFWEDSLPDGVLEPDLVLADGDVDTACGAATQDEGSFFCGADSTVYLQQVDLDEPAGGAGEAARVYLLAHEYGHAVQDQLGVDDGDAGPGPDGDSVRYELQADCLAGAYVATRGDAVDVEPYRDAVRGSGDDAGEPLPEAEYEHGSSAQRLDAFDRGYDGGPQACDLEVG